MQALTLIGYFNMKYYFLLTLLIFFKCSIYSDVSFVDIPTTDYREILACHETEIEYLNQLVEHYHSLDKSSSATQILRISSLQSIADYLNALSIQGKFSEIKSTIYLLKNHVQSKSEYIKKLLEIPTDQEIERYHLDFSTHLNREFVSIPMRNDLSYSLKMKENWGAFWLESIDPCHRRLANYYQFWLNTKPVNQSYQSFFLWLEEQPISVATPAVSYYSEEQLNKCLIEFESGYLINNETKELVTTPKNSRNIFILNLEEQLYLETVSTGVWHNSLSLGKPVLCAGLLNVEDGLIHSVAFESGHYLPSQFQGFKFLKFLIEKNIRFKNSFELTYFENRNKYKVALNINCLESFEAFTKSMHDILKRELISSNEF